MSRFFLSAAALTLTLAVAQPASAFLTENGLGINALTENALTENALTQNGVKISETADRARPGPGLGARVIGVEMPLPR